MKAFEGMRNVLAEVPKAQLRLAASRLEKRRPKAMETVALGEALSCMDFSRGLWARLLMAYAQERLSKEIASRMGAVPISSGQGFMREDLRTYPYGPAWRVDGS